MTNATYKLHQRPEGWTMSCTILDKHTSVSFYKTEYDARDALNKALANAGLHQHMIFK